MKRAGFLIEQIAEYENLLHAFHKAQSGKEGKNEVIIYRNDLQDNLSELREELLAGKVSVGDYYQFKIFDPKERVVCAAAFRERVLHHALMNICAPIFEKQFIATTCANRTGKGVYYAINYAMKGMKNHSYVAKMDIRKYFDSIDHDILSGKLKHIFKDRRLTGIFDRIIDSYCVETGKGVPIGNLTSQYFANYYLSSLDHYIKEVLHVPIYVRYMDDMLLFENDKIRLKEVIRQVEKYLLEELHLDLKFAIVNSTISSTSFLGYRLSRNRIGLTSRSKRRFRNKFTIIDRQLSQDQITESDAQNSAVPLFTFVKHAYTKQYRYRVISEVTNRKRLQPRESRRQLEQQCAELPSCQS